MQINTITHSQTRRIVGSIVLREDAGFVEDPENSRDLKRRYEVSETLQATAKIQYKSGKRSIPCTAIGEG